MSAKTTAFFSSTWVLDVLGEKKKRKDEESELKKRQTTMEIEKEDEERKDEKNRPLLFLKTPSPVVTPSTTHLSPKNKGKKKRLINVENIKEIISISKPQILEKGYKKTTKGYKITVTFKDLNDKEHVKRILFGSPKRSYFIEHKNAYTRASSLSRLKKNPGILDARFYEIKLLDGPNFTLEENYCDLIKEILG